MSKFFVNNNQVNDGIIKISGDSFNHIKNVLRLKQGEQLQICDVDNKVNYLCKIKDFFKDYIDCSIIEKLENTTETNVYINIFQGIPKADKMEWIIEKCTEIGVSEFNMERCVVKIDEKSKEKKISRWQKIAQSAAMQSGRDIIPSVNNIIKFDDLRKFINEYDVVLVAYENEQERIIKDELRKIDSISQIKIAVVIGPEGRN